MKKVRQKFGIKYQPLILVIFFGALLTLHSCKQDAYPKMPLLCTWPKGYYSGENVKNNDTEIVLSEAALAQNDSVYVIRMNESIGKLSANFLVPCNLPNTAKKNGLKIKVSGHIVRFDMFDSSLFVYGYPFEITNIEYLD